MSSTDAPIGQSPAYPLDDDQRVNLAALRVWQSLPSTTIAADPPRVWRSCLEAARHDLAEPSAIPALGYCSVDVTPSVEVAS